MTQPRDTQILLMDIQNAVTICLQMVQGLNFEQFRSDLKTTSATLYQIALVGEAATRIPSDFKSQHPQIPWRKMSDMRNVLIHHYEGVNLATVWQTLHNNLPKIQKDVKNILDDLSS